MAIVKNQGIWRERISWCVSCPWKMDFINPATNKDNQKISKEILQIQKPADTLMVFSWRG